MYVVVSVCLQIGSGASAANINQTTNLYNDLFGSYNKDLLPILDDSRTVLVKITYYIVSINDFDEISGKMVLSFLFHLEWMEERMSWNASNYGEKMSLHLPANLIWKPNIYLQEAAHKTEEIGSKPGIVRVYADGRVTWLPGEVIHSTCSVDVQNFPFDTQTCDLHFGLKDYLAEEVSLISMNTTLQTDYFSENSQWILSWSEIYNGNSSAAPPISFVHLKLVLQRRHLFYVIYILCPLMFLVLINKLVFFMPASSGERTSVAVTLFLAFVVYMGTIYDNVPASSNPVAYIYLTVLILMLYSSMIMVLCIISLRIYDKTGKVPLCIQKAVRMLRFWRLCKERQKAKIRHGPHDELHNSSDVSESKDDTKTLQDDIGDQKRPNCTEIVTWQLVGKTFDLYCYILCLIFILISFVDFCATGFNYTI